MRLKPGVVDVNPIAISNAFTFVKNMPDDGLVVILDIGAVSSTLVVYGKGQLYFTRYLLIGGHHFVRNCQKKKKSVILKLRSMLYKDGLSSAISNVSADPAANVGNAERTVYDNLVEDLRRSLRFNQTNWPKFFPENIFIWWCSDTPGLSEFVQAN